MGQTQALLLQGSTTCIEWLVALVLIVVGAIPIRKAEARAGYLVIGTGMLWLMSTCCGLLPTLRWQISPGEPGILEAVVPWFSFLLEIAGLGALIAAAVVMARALIALGGGAK